MSTPDLDRLRARLVVIAADATNHPLTFGHMIMRAMNEVVEPLAAENAALREQVQREYVRGVEEAYDHLAREGFDLYAPGVAEFVGRLPALDGDQPTGGAEAGR